MRSLSGDESVATRALVEERAEREQVLQSPLKRTGGTILPSPCKTDNSSESEFSQDLMKKGKWSSRSPSPTPNIPNKGVDQFLDAEFSKGDYVDVYVDAEFANPAHIIEPVRKPGSNDLYYKIKWENPLPTKPAVDVLKFDYVVGHSAGPMPRGFRVQLPDVSSLPQIEYTVGDEVNVICEGNLFEATIVAILQSYVPQYRIKWHDSSNKFPTVIRSDQIPDKSQSVSSLTKKQRPESPKSRSRKPKSPDSKTRSKKARRSSSSSSELTSEYSVGDTVMAYGGSGSQVFKAVIKGIITKTDSKSYIIKWDQVFNKSEREVKPDMISYKIEPSPSQSELLYSVGDQVEVKSGTSTSDATITAVIPGPPLKYRIRLKKVPNGNKAEKEVTSNVIKGLAQPFMAEDSTSSSSDEPAPRRKPVVTKGKPKATARSSSSSSSSEQQVLYQVGDTVKAYSGGYQFEATVLKVNESRKVSYVIKWLEINNRGEEEVASNMIAKLVRRPRPKVEPKKPTQKTDSKKETKKKNTERATAKYEVDDLVKAYYGPDQILEAVVVDVNLKRKPVYSLLFTEYYLTKKGVTEDCIVGLARKIANKKPAPTETSPKQKPKSAEKKKSPTPPKEKPAYKESDLVLAYSSGGGVFEATIEEVILGPPLSYKIRWVCPLNPREPEMVVASNMIKEKIKKVSEKKQSSSKQPPQQHAKPPKAPARKEPTYQVGDIVTAYSGPMTFEAKIIERIEEGDKLKYQIQWSEMFEREKVTVESNMIKDLVSRNRCASSESGSAVSTLPSSNRFVYQPGTTVDIFTKGKSGACDRAQINNFAPGKGYSVTWEKSGKTAMVSPSRVKRTSSPNSPASVSSASDSVVEIGVAKYKADELVTVTPSKGDPFEGKVVSVHCNPIRYRVTSVASPHKNEVVSEERLSTPPKSPARSNKKRKAPNTTATKKRQQPEYCIEDRVVATQLDGCVNCHATITKVISDDEYEVKWDVVKGSKVSKTEIISSKRINGHLKLLPEETNTSLHSVGTTIIAKQHQMNESRAVIVEVMETNPEGKYRVEWETVFPFKSKSKRPADIVLHSEIYRVETENLMTIKVPRAQSDSSAVKSKKPRSTPTPPPEKRPKPDVESSTLESSDSQKHIPKHSIGKSFLINDPAASPSCKIYKIIGIKKERGEDSIKVQLLLTSDPSDCPPCNKNCPIPSGRKVIETASALWVSPSILEEEVYVIHVTKLPTLYYIEKRLNKDGTFTFIEDLDTKRIYHVRKSDGSVGVAKVLSSTMSEYVEVRWYINFEQDGCDDNCEVPHTRQLIETTKTESIHCDQLIPKRIEVLPLPYLQKCFFTDGNRLSVEDQTFVDKSHEIELRGIPEMVRGRPIFKSFAVGHQNPTMYGAGCCVKFRQKEKYQYGEIINIIKASETQCYVDISRFNQTGTNTLCRSGYTVRVCPTRITTHINVISFGYRPPVNVATAHFETFWLLAPN